MSSTISFLTQWFFRIAMMSLLIWRSPFPCVNAFLLQITIVPQFEGFLVTGSITHSRCIYYNRTTTSFVQDSKQNLTGPFRSIFLIRLKPMIKQFSHFSQGKIGKRRYNNWLNGNSSKSNILWLAFLAASTSIPPSGSPQDPTTSSLVAEPPNSILIVLTSQCVFFHVSFLSLSLILIVFFLMLVLFQMFQKSKKRCSH